MKKTSYVRKELYEDVLAEDPSEKKGFNFKAGFQSKEYKRWEQRLHNSIGWTEPEEHHEVVLEKAKPGKFGPIKLASSSLGSTIHWDVNLEEGSFTCKSQEHAHILSLLVQMNERLKRMEAKLNQEDSIYIA